MSAVGHCNVLCVALHSSCPGKEPARLKVATAQPQAAVNANQGKVTDLKSEGEVDRQFPSFQEAAVCWAVPQCL